MLVASFLAGNIPLSFHLSEDRLKLISNFGVGLLVGTSLVVIIPEGVETLYSVPQAPKAPAPAGSAGLGSAHNKPIKRSYSHPDTVATGFALVSGVKRAAQDVGLVKRADQAVALNQDHAYLIQDQFMKESVEATSSFEDNMLRTRHVDRVATFEHGFDPASDVDPDAAENNAQESGQNTTPIVKRQDGEGEQKDALPDDQEGTGNDSNNDQNNGDESGHTHDEDEEDNDVHKYIGLALLAGFILMFLIDQMGPTHAHSHNNHVSVADFTELHNLQLDDSNIRMPSAAGMNAGSKMRGNPITIGLVVHAAADGIALGASASRPELRLIVFLAIMLHKAPAAFGLATVLLQHGFSRRQTRQQVGIFSLAAPIGAIVTYMFIQLSGQHDEASLHWWTGMLLLFSGGTFLYVAMHVMSEMNNTERTSSSSGYGVGGAGGEKGLSIVEVMCVIGGMVVPLLLSVDHEH
ncbi:hypothetical protein BG011_006673 [Mortierella polycephala]|uniref:Zinc/iron permease n=1 Tax=Mortierella polycephala TaxID=41804 RepID=A0A9P6TZP3_9FUNG|nr:hypothetical protein BG011_006673 [Mortierella polycephala]